MNMMIQTYALGVYILDLRNLRYFVMLARRLNYVRAADELGITQPTLTRSIQTLERQLGVRLFDRDRGGVNLTPQGHQVAERAAFLLNDADDLENHTRLYGQGESGRIRFGMAPMPAHAMLRPVLAERLAIAPNVTNEVVVRDVEALWGMLVAGEIEFFVSPDRPLHDLSHAQVELLGLFPLSLLVRADHPLLDGLSGQKRFPMIRSSWTGISVPTEIQPYILGDANIIEDFSTLAGIAATTDAIWLSSQYAVKADIVAGTLVELLRPHQHLEVMLYSLRRRTRTPLALAVTCALREWISAVVTVA